MRRSLTVHGALLVAALLAAYDVWTREPSTASEDAVPIVRLPELSALSYSDPQHRVTITRKSGDDGSYFWVESETRPKAGAPPSAAAKQPSKKSAFLGNEATEQLMKTMSHAPATRALGKLDQKKLAEIGLDKSTVTLELRAGATKRTLAIGSRAFGNTDTYVMDRSDGTVYLVEPELLQNLTQANTHLFDRRLHDFELGDVTRVVISTPEGQKKTLLQEGSPTARQWRSEGAKETTDRADVYRNWLRKLDLQRAMAYVDPAKQPKHTKQIFRVEYFRGSRSLGFIDVLVEPTVAPNTLAAFPKGAGTYVARTEHTRGLVELPRTAVEELERDLENMLKS